MLKLGDIVSGKLIEAIDETHWIVSFDGQLIQVVNASPIKFEKNKIVKLRVTKERPIQLQMASHKGFRQSLDLKV